MSKFFIIVMAFTMFMFFAGCDQKPMYPKKKKKQITETSITSASKKSTKKTQSTKKKRTSNVGIADAADYATGMTQLKTKQFSKKRLNSSYGNRNKRINEAIKENQ